MAKWEQLIKARERLHLSQLEAAERVKVGLTTYQRWEAGRAKPQPHHRRQIDQAFGSLLENGVADLEGARFAHQEQPAPPLTNSSAPLPEALDEPQAFIATNMTTHLWSLAFKQHLTCEEKRASIRQAIKDFDNMNNTNQSYQITRRDALCSLATLPMITLGLTSSTSTLPPNRYGDMLARSTASLEACWELRKSSDPNDIALVFKSASRYLPILEGIAGNAARYRQESLDLAARYAVLKTFLSRHRIGPAATIQQAKHALALSKATGDISLQLSAYNELAITYSSSKKYVSALATIQEAEQLLQQQKFSNDQLHPVVQSGVYSILAGMQAKNGKSLDVALGRAMELTPEDGSYPFMDFKWSVMVLDAGWAYCYSDDQAKAMQMLEMRIDPQTLAPKIVQSEIGRIETINAMTLSSLKSKDRDMEKAIHLWLAGIEGAKALKSETRFNEAIAAYEFMQILWPGEKRIRDLRSYITHWSEGPSVND